MLSDINVQSMDPGYKLTIIIALLVVSLAVSFTAILISLFVLGYLFKKLPKKSTPVLIAKKETDELNPMCSLHAYNSPVFNHHYDEEKEQL